MRNEGCNFKREIFPEIGRILSFLVEIEFLGEDQPEINDVDFSAITDKMAGNEGLVETLCMERCPFATKLEMAEITEGIALNMRAPYFYPTWTQFSLSNGSFYSNSSTTVRRVLMKLRKSQHLFLFCIPLFLFMVSPVNAQSLQAESATGVGSAQLDQEILDKFNDWAPGRLDELDGKLAEALTLYYDGKYGQALPIFTEIASQVETTDIMWWIGTSAMNTGNLELASRKFQQMLSADPKLHRVRLELATVYFQLGKYQEAGQELETVKASSPPEAVKANIEKLLVAIREATRKFMWNIRFSQGVQYDSNINAGPDIKLLEVSGGTLALADESTKTGGYASITNFGGNVLYRIDSRRGIMWNTALDFYQTAYFDHSKFNYRLIDISTGPWFSGRQDILKVPVGVSFQELGSDRLSNIFHIDPSYEHYFSPYFSLRGAFRYSSERFYQDDNDPLNNTSKRYEITPSFYLGNRQHIISLTVGYETSEADQRRFSYDGPYYAVSYFTRFSTQTEFFLRYQWSQRDFKEKPLLYEDYRVDRRQMITAVVSQGFYKHYFASFAFNYINNHSNAELYNFDKETYTLSLGFYF
jgi:tetratricopeptide (TPR) repeat protein